MPDVNLSNQAGSGPATDRTFSMRRIRAEDDQALANVIRTVMPEFGACGDGFAINDPEVDEMFAEYSQQRHYYFVIEDEAGRVLGGGGVAPLAGGAPGICELRKMYFLPELRGTGWGKTLLLACFAKAKELGFSTMYLETLENMTGARRLYEKLGFQQQSMAMGSTGHHGCDTFYSRQL